MKQLHKTLSDSLGFSSKKSQVYLALLELGETEASTVAQKAGLKRTTVYNILPELVSDGFVSTTLRKGKKIFFIESPTILEKRLEEKRESICSIIPDLTTMQSMFYHKPKITLHEGVSGCKDIYDDFIRITSSGDTVLSYAGTRDHYRYLPEDFLKKYLKKRVSKRIRLKLIAGTSPLSKELSNTSSSELREIKLTDNPSFDFSGETIIYGNKVAFISYKENFLGVVIESKEISAMHKATFALLWERL